MQITCKYSHNNEKLTALHALLTPGQDSALEGVISTCLLLTLVHQSCYLFGGRGRGHAFFHILRMCPPKNTQTM